MHFLHLPKEYWDYFGDTFLLHTPWRSYFAESHTVPNVPNNFEKRKHTWQCKISYQPHAPFCMFSCIQRLSRDELKQFMLFQHWQHFYKIISNTFLSMYVKRRKTSPLSLRFLPALSAVDKLFCFVPSFPTRKDAAKLKFRWGELLIRRAACKGILSDLKNNVSDSKNFQSTVLNGSNAVLQTSLLRRNRRWEKSWL